MDEGGGGDGHTLGGVRYGVECCGGREGGRVVCGGGGGAGDGFVRGLILMGYEIFHRVIKHVWSP